MPKKTSKEFRTDSSRFFLTFPQCSISKEDALQNLVDHTWPTPLVEEEKQPELKFAIVSEEKHKDGTPHLHVYFSLTAKLRTRRVRIFDFIGAKHPNIESARSESKCIKYVIKDGNYVLHGISEEALGILCKPHRAGISDLVKDILENPFDQLSLQMKYLSLHGLHPHAISTMTHTVRQVRARDVRSEMDWSVETDYFRDSPQGVIEAWIRARLDRSTRIPRKAKQLYIYGATNLGKTTLLDRLAKHFSIYTMPKEDFQDFWSDSAYQLCVLDEFIGGKKVSWLNSWLEGSTMNLRVKGSQRMKEFNIPTLMLSNSSPEECYRAMSLEHPVRFAAFLGRLTIVHLTEPLFDWLDQFFPLPPAEPVSPLDSDSDHLEDCCEEEEEE